jgi:hypothetical protein
MKKKKTISLADLMKQAELNSQTKKDIYKTKYKQSLKSSHATDEDEKLIEKLHLTGGQKGKGKYSLRTKILNHPWVKSGRPASSALKWLYREVFKDPKTYKHNKFLLDQGELFIFEYKNPKYKDNLKVLPWWDQYPLVISLGPIVTNEGVRNIGFNLHLLPPKIRIIVLCKIFELHKILYRYMIFYNKNNPVKIDYKLIVKNLEKFGVKFAIRMYIPKRQNQIVSIPYRDWHNGIFIPSRAYSRIRSAQLIKAWKEFCHKNGNTISPNINWKMNI